MKFHRSGMFGEQRCDHQEPPCYCKPPLMRKSKKDPGVCSHCHLERDGLKETPPFCNCNPTVLGPRDPCTPDGLPIILPNKRCVLCKLIRGVIPSGYILNGESGCDCYPPKLPSGRCGHCSKYIKAPCCSGITNIMGNLCSCNYVAPPPVPPSAPPKPRKRVRLPRRMPSCIVCGYRRLASPTEPWSRDGKPCNSCGDITIQSVPLNRAEKEVESETDSD